LKPLQLSPHVEVIQSADFLLINFLKIFRTATFYQGSSEGNNLSLNARFKVSPPNRRKCDGHNIMYRDSAETLGDRFTVSAATYPQNYAPSLPRIQQFLNHWIFFWNVSIIILKPSLKGVGIETSEI
jgi:hypothetical protein